MRGTAIRLRRERTNPATTDLRSRDGRMWPELQPADLIKGTSCVADQRCMPIVPTIDAAYRGLHDVDLKEAKEAVERLAERLSPPA
jgi:hypothetical protein